MPRRQGLLRDAEQVLHMKQLDYAAAKSLRQALLRQLALLEEQLQDSSDARRMQELASRLITASLVRTPQQQGPAGMQCTQHGLALEALPESLAGYSDALLQRIACMGPGDSLEVYKTFLAQ